jgi:hypothetical protein
VEKNPSEKKTHTSHPGDLGRWMMDIKHSVVTRIIEETVSKFDAEKLARYRRVMERRQDGSNSC